MFDVEVEVVDAVLVYYCLVGWPGNSNRPPPPPPDQTRPEGNQILDLSSMPTSLTIDYRIENSTTLYYYTDE